MKAFIESQFGYCPLVWMFCGRQTNARINHIHERALRAVYNDEISPFEELLGRDKSETIHRRNIKILAAELFKIKNGLSNDIMTQLICKINSKRLQSSFTNRFFVVASEICKLRLKSVAIFWSENMEYSS